jgi:type II secretory pathway component GspD/PulD (secretin)
MCFRFTGVAAFMLLGFAAGALAQTVAPQSGRAAEERSTWSFVVIKLKYAEAEEIARVLRQLLPPTVSVAPYSHTNSVLIAGDRATLEEIGAWNIETEF